MRSTRKECASGFLGRIATVEQRCFPAARQKKIDQSEQIEQRVLGALDVLVVRVQRHERAPRFQEAHQPRLDLEWHGRDMADARQSWRRRYLARHQRLLEM